MNPDEFLEPLQCSRALPCPGTPPGAQDSPMQISSSVSASPMQRNLNSLRESANLRLAAERSAREERSAGMSQMGTSPAAGCRHTHDPRQEIPTGKYPGTRESPLHPPQDRALWGQHPQNTLQEMKPQNTKGATPELGPRAMGQQQTVAQGDTAPQEMSPLPRCRPTEGRQHLRALLFPSCRVWLRAGSY